MCLKYLKPLLLFTIGFLVSVNRECCDAIPLSNSVLYKDTGKLPKLKFHLV